MFLSKLEFSAVRLCESIAQGASIGGIDAYYRGRSVWQSAAKIAALFVTAEIFTQAVWQALPLSHSPCVMLALLAPTALELGIFAYTHLFARKTRILSPTTAALSFSLRAVRVLKHISLTCYALLRPGKAGIIS